MAEFRRPAIAICYGLAILLIGGQSPERSDVTVQTGPRFGVFSVVNHGAPVSLCTAVSVEQLTDGVWKPVSVTNLYLRETCLPEPPPPCTYLPADSTIHPIPWTGRFCAAQCPSTCRLDGSAPTGVYRFVVPTCAGTQKIVSSPFEKPK